MAAANNNKASLQDEVKSKNQFNNGNDESGWQSQKRKKKPKKNVTNLETTPINSQEAHNKKPQCDKQKGDFEKPKVNSNSQPKESNESQLNVKIASSELQEIEESGPPPVRSMSSAGIRRGTLGVDDVVEVNYLKLNIDKMPDIAYHYDVTITPGHPKKCFRAALQQFQRVYCPNILIAFDGVKSCYTVTKLPQKNISQTVNIDDNGNLKEFVLNIKETEKLVVDLKSMQTYRQEPVYDKPMTALQVLEVVLASKNYELGVRVGRSFYSKPKEFVDLGDGYEMYTGIYQAAILGEEPFFNVDIVHKSFPQSISILMLLAQRDISLDNAIMDKRALTSLTEFLHGMQILYEPPKCFGVLPRLYKFLGIVKASNKITFLTTEGQKICVKDYFALRGYNLQYPHLECLEVGSVHKSIVLPMELCSIAPHQSLNRKDGANQVSQMIKYTATSTTVRKNKIMDLMRCFDHNSNPIIRAFGLKLGSNFIKVHMRMLPPPMIEYFQGKTIGVFKGVWRSENVAFLKPCIKGNGDYRFAITFSEQGVDHNLIAMFKQSILKSAKEVKMKLNPDVKICTFTQIDLTLQQLKRENFDMVFVVIPNIGISYAHIKQSAEIHCGILTQCIKQRTLGRINRNMTIINNILLKVNTKLNGTNHKLTEQSTTLKNLLKSLENVMFIGADVTHPSPTQSNIPSVVGVAASHDQFGACYNMQYRLQKAAVETISDMESIVIYHLQIYKKNRKCLPSHIIYYRDGVSEGQFPSIKNIEIRQINSACKRLQCKAKVTCIIVVKRHHTRFFPTKPCQANNPNNNVAPGTIVDQYIVHPNEQQFFLVSHQAILGTARPTRYNIIYDDAKLDIDLIQKLTYNLCHLFPRCNRAVSYPAPAYLAHLVAFRGRVYLEGASRFEDLPTEYNKRKVHENIMIKSPMYFV